MDLLITLLISSIIGFVIGFFGWGIYVRFLNE